MSEHYIVGLDLGGTNIKARLVDEQGVVQARHDVPTQADGGPEHVTQRLADAARKVCTCHEVDIAAVAGIGVGSPGPLDDKAGTVISSVNLPGWRNHPLRDELSRLTGKPVVILNDANAACYGEYWVGAGRGVEDLVMFTLGTGLGGGVISSGTLLCGHFGQAGELGHMVVDPDGPQCGCGQHGCLEVFASEPHMIRRAVELGVWPVGDGHNARDLLQAVEDGHEGAQRVWNECCQAIATAILTLQHVLNPAMVVLGGGVSAAGDRLLTPVREAHARLMWSLADDAPSIELAALGNDAGAIGAAGWFLRSREMR